MKLKSDALELLVLEIASKHSKSFYLASWYRPLTPEIDIQAFEILRKELKILNQNEKEIILVGDANCDFKWNKNYNAKSPNFSTLNFSLNQQIRSYTKVTTTHNGNDGTLISKALIDYFATYKATYILKVDTIETGMVDNYMIYGIMKINAVRLNSFKKQNFSETRSLKGYNKDLFKQDFQRIDWANLLTTLENEPSKVVVTFQDIFESLLNTHPLPRTKKLSDEFTPRLTTYVGDLKAKRD